MIVIAPLALSYVRADAEHVTEVSHVRVVYHGIILT